MSNWTETTVGAIAEYVTVGYVGSMSSEYLDEGVLFLRSQNIEPFRLNLNENQIKYVSEEFHKKIAKSKLVEDDIAMVRTGYPGTCCVIPRGLGELNCSDLVIIRPKRKIVDSNFLCYFLNSPLGKASIEGNLVGAAQQHFNIGVAKKIKVKLPGLLVQRKISSILSNFDDLVSYNERRIVLLEKMAEEIYKEWFVRLRFPGYETLRIVDGVYEGWVQNSLDQVLIINMGQSPKSEFYNDIGEGLPFHQGVTNFGNRFPVHRMYCTDEKRVAEEGDILLSVRAPVGRINIADRKMIIGRGLGAIRHKNNQQSYCYYLLKNIFKVEDSFGNGAVFNAVSKTEVASIKVIIPDGKIVEKFNSLVAPFDHEIQVLEKKNKILKQTRDLLLPRLISGKLSVEHLLDDQ